MDYHDYWMVDFYKDDTYTTLYKRVSQQNATGPGLVVYAPEILRGLVRKSFVPLLKTTTPWRGICVWFCISIPSLKRHYFMKYGHVNGHLTCELVASICFIVLVIHVHMICHHLPGWRLNAMHGLWQTRRVWNKLLHWWNEMHLQTKVERESLRHPYQVQLWAIWGFVCV